MNIHLVTYAYGLSTELREMFHSADAPGVTWHLFLHSRQPDVVDTCYDFARRSNVILYPYGTDRGLARSCNEAIMAAQEAGADVVIQICDDILAGAGDIQRLAAAALDNPGCSWVGGHTFVERVGRWDAGSMDVCAINLGAVDKIGYFDINCWPVNFEDTDWKRRAALSGLLPVMVGDTSFIHRAIGEGGESEAFRRTRDYYCAKWGGDQGAERYSLPFNDPRYDLTISRDRADNPYPEYARTDLVLS